jgi:hypothetical protein
MSAFKPHLVAAVLQQHDGLVKENRIERAHSLTTSMRNNRTGAELAPLAESIRYKARWISILLTGIIMICFIINALKLLLTAETDAERKSAAQSLSNILSLIPSVGAVSDNNATTENTDANNNTAFIG